jgi:SAM-dependent methyltransferase
MPVLSLPGGWAMRRRAFIRVIGVAAVAAAVFVLLRPYVHERYFYRNPGQTAREQLNPWRRELMQPERVVEALRLQPDMTILDLGSGYGFFTFALARAVGDKGTVFATDTDPSVADFLTNRATRLEVKNVIPIVVRQFGLDPFYKTHTFDVVIACDVIPYLGNRADERAFLEELSHSLKKNGRLWVLMHRFDADFDAAEFGDWRVATKALRSPGAQASLLKRLSPQARAALDVEPATPGAELLKDLNRMLDDPALWPDIARQFQPLDWYLSPHYRLPRDYLVAKVEQAGGFAQTPQDVPERARPLLRLLNRLVIQDLLDTFVWEKAFHLDEYDMHNWKQRIEGMTLASPVLTIEDAGYQLVQEYKILTSHHVWEFRRADNSIEYNSDPLGGERTFSKSPLQSRIENAP